VKRLIVIALAAAVGLGLAGPVRAQEGEDLEKTELMLHGLMAVHASAVMTMRAYDAGLLTKEEATSEHARNAKFLAVLSKVAANLDRSLALSEQEEISFAKEFLQVCTYMDLALNSLEKYIAEGNELDHKLFDRYIAKTEEAMTRLLKRFSGR
jgi:hypothetical protein